MKCLRILSLAVAGALLLSSGAALAKKPLPVSNCGTVITDPGKYFVTQDLFCVGDEQGVTILASDVTLDLNGHTITCNSDPTIPPTDLVGAVLVGDYFNPDFVVEKVTVKNGTVTGCDDAVIYFFTRGGKITKITATGNPGAGITLLAANGLVVRDNNSSANVFGIRSYGGVGNTIKHNTTNGNFPESGIFLFAETDSKVACNKSAGNFFAIGVGPFSSGNVVNGNFMDGNFGSGVNVWGWLDGDYYEPVPWDNVIEKNVVRNSGIIDLDEIVFDAQTGTPFVDEELGCQNTWRKNDYTIPWGPVDCIAPPVELDDDDVCALDDDADSDSD